jgi:hypothetical protein
MEDNKQKEGTGEQQQTGQQQSKSAESSNPLDSILDFLKNPTVLTMGLAGAGIWAFLEHQKKNELQKELNIIKHQFSEQYEKKKKKIKKLKKKLKEKKNEVEKDLGWLYNAEDKETGKEHNKFKFDRSSKAISPYLN